jgi:hypothetical protein
MARYTFRCAATDRWKWLSAVSRALAVLFAESPADRTVRTVIFDLDDTLWPVLPPLQRATEILLDRLAAYLPKTAARGIHGCDTRAAESQGPHALVSLQYSEGSCGSVYSPRMGGPSLRWWRII